MSVSVSVGQKVILDGRKVGENMGVVRYVGPVKGVPGPCWIGVELDSATGKNDGSVKGTRYFQCKPNHGVFVPPSSAKPAPARTAGNAAGASGAGASAPVSTPKSSQTTNKGTAAVQSRASPVAAAGGGSGGTPSRPGVSSSSTASPSSSQGVSSRLARGAGAGAAATAKSPVSTRTPGSAGQPRRPSTTEARSSRPVGNSQVQSSSGVVQRKAPSPAVSSVPPAPAASSPVSGEKRSDTPHAIADQPVASLPSVSARSEVISPVESVNAADSQQQAAVQQRDSGAAAAVAAKVDALQTSLALEKDKLDKLAKENADLRTRLEQQQLVSQPPAAADDGVAELRSSAAKSAETVERLTRELQDTRLQLDQQSKERQRSDDQLEQSRQRLDELQLRYDALLNRQQQQRQEQEQELDRSSESDRAAVAQLQAKVQQQQSGYQKTQADLLQAQRDLAAMERRHAQCQHELKQAQLAIDDYREQTEDARQEAELAAVDAALAREQLVAAQDELRSRFALADHAVGAAAVDPAAENHRLRLAVAVLKKTAGAAAQQRAEALQSAERKAAEAAAAMKRAVQLESSAAEMKALADDGALARAQAQQLAERNEQLEQLASLAAADAADADTLLEVAAELEHALAAAERAASQRAVRAERTTRQVAAAAAAERRRCETLQRRLTKSKLKCRSLRQALAESFSAVDAPTDELVGASRRTGWSGDANVGAKLGALRACGLSQLAAANDTVGLLCSMLPPSALDAAGALTRTAVALHQAEAAAFVLQAVGEFPVRFLIAQRRQQAWERRQKLSGAISSDVNGDSGRLAPKQNDDGANDPDSDDDGISDMFSEQELTAAIECDSAGRVLRAAVACARQALMTAPPATAADVADRFQALLASFASTIASDINHLLVEQCIGPFCVYGLDVLAQSSSSSESDHQSRANLAVANSKIIAVRLLHAVWQVSALVPAGTGDDVRRSKAAAAAAELAAGQIGPELLAAAGAVLPWANPVLSVTARALARARQSIISSGDDQRRLPVAKVAEELANAVDRCLATVAPPQELVTTTAHPFTVDLWAKSHERAASKQSGQQLYGGQPLTEEVSAALIAWGAAPIGGQPAEALRIVEAAMTAILSGRQQGLQPTESVGSQNPGGSISQMLLKKPREELASAAAARAAAASATVDARKARLETASLRQQLAELQWQLAALPAKLEAARQRAVAAEASAAQIRKQYPSQLRPPGQVAASPSGAEQPNHELGPHDPADDRDALGRSGMDGDVRDTGGGPKKSMSRRRQNGQPRQRFFVASLFSPDEAAAHPWSDSGSDASWSSSDEDSDGFGGSHDGTNEAGNVRRRAHHASLQQLVARERRADRHRLRELARALFAENARLRLDQSSRRLESLAPLSSPCSGCTDGNRIGRFAEVLNDTRKRRAQLQLIRLAPPQGADKDRVAPPSLQMHWRRVELTMLTQRVEETINTL